MSSRIRNRHIRLYFTLTVALLAGCVAVDRVEPTADPRIGQLVTSMDNCLANQAQTNEQLQNQEQQLGRQQQQLDGLIAGLNADKPTPTDHAEGSATCTQLQEPSSKLVVGQLEQVWLPNLQLMLTARIDTGAETASLDARDIELFERDSRRWVRFEIFNPETGEPLILERKLKRMVTIIQSNSLEPERRPVIKLGVSIGHVNQTAEFTLSNRSHLDYQLLIGRNILQDVMVVDVSKKNIAPYVVPEKQGTGAVP